LTTDPDECRKESVDVFYHQKAAVFRKPRCVMLALTLDLTMKFILGIVIVTVLLDMFWLYLWARDEAKKWEK
jgi:hypothetical protein